MLDYDRLLQFTSECILCTLSKDYFENDIHSEYQIRKRKLDLNFEEIISLISTVDFTQKSDTVNNTLCYLIIFYLELQTKGPWNSELTGVEEKATKINEIFNNKYNIDVSEVLKSDKSNGIFESEALFEKCIRELHKTITKDDFKKHPSLIEVYCMLGKDLKEYKININPVTVLPVALLLIDDYIPCNKVKGLQFSASVFQCLTPQEFIAGNYYEVVYSSLKKNILDKDNDVTQALFDAFLEYIKIIPFELKNKKLDDLFSNVVDQIYTESNLYRKVICFKFVTNIIDLHGIHCIRKKVFRTIIHENLDMCSSGAVSEILLHPVLDCLHMWLRYCWCIWLLSEGHRILSTLFKILYLCRDETTRLKIHNTIVTLIKLCLEGEQNDILESLQEPLDSSNKEFLASIEAIKIQIKVPLKCNKIT